MDYSTLKQQIVDEIKQSPIANTNSRALKQMIQNGTANYQTVAQYSKVLGDVTSKCIERNIASGISDEELGAFANECLAPIYRQSQDTMLGACKSVQKLYNKQAGLELNPIDVKRDESRIEHIVERFEEAEKFDTVKFLTNSNVARSITRGAVQDSIRRNAKFQADAGLKIRISRSDGSGCCDWCSSVVGTYDSFDALPDGFWGIHRGCTCVIDYRVGKTRDRISFNTKEDGSLEKATEHIEEREATNYKEREITSKQLPLISKSNILQTKNVEEIANYMKSNYDIDIYGFEKHELSKVQATFAGIDDVLKEYTKACDFIKNIRYNKNIDNYGEINQFGTMLIGNKGIGSYTTGLHESYHAVDYSYSNGDKRLSEIVCKNAIKTLNLQEDKTTYKLLAYQITGAVHYIHEYSEILAYSAEAVVTNSGNNKLSATVIEELRKAIR